MLGGLSLGLGLGGKEKKKGNESKGPSHKVCVCVYVCNVSIDPSIHPSIHPLRLVLWPAFLSLLQVPPEHREKGCELRVGRDICVKAYSRESIIAAKDCVAARALREMAEGKVMGWAGSRHSFLPSFIHSFIHPPRLSPFASRLVLPCSESGVSLVPPRSRGCC